MAAALQQAWTRRGALACLLLPLALLFGALAGLRGLLYRHGILKASRVARPVVVVGNLVVGGAGKTPLVIALIEQLRAHGYTPGVVSRGHGGTVQGVARADAHDAARYGDEVVLIARRTGAPVWVGRDRVAAAQRLIADCPDIDVILSDDGLQHAALARDVDIAVFDGRGAGNGWLLPAGPLREPLARLAQVDAVVLNGLDGLDELQGFDRRCRVTPTFQMRIVGTHAYALADPAHRVALADLQGRSLLAAAGIGNPARFFRTLDAAGLRFRTLPLPDHYDYRIDPFAAEVADIILVTEKDAVKCTHLGDARLWVVPVEAEVDSGLAQLIIDKLSRLNREKPRGSAPA